MRERPELTKFERTMSMMRYRPPKGTAGFARSSVSGKRRRPSPPASTMTSTWFWSKFSARGCISAAT